MSSVCHNPFIYCWLNDSFRRKTKSLFSFVISFSNAFKQVICCKSGQEARSSSSGQQQVTEQCPESASRNGSQSNKSCRQQSRDNSMVPDESTAAAVKQSSWKAEMVSSDMMRSVISGSSGKRASSCDECSDIWALFTQTSILPTGLIMVETWYKPPPQTTLAKHRNGGSHRIPSVTVMNGDLFANWNHVGPHCPPSPMFPFE